MYKLFLVVVLISGFGFIGSTIYNGAMKPSGDELSHKQQLKETAQRIAVERVNEKMDAYRQAFSTNKGVACKISREMTYWSAQTGDTKIIGTVHRMQSEACRRV